MSDYRYQRIAPQDRYDMKFKNEGGYLHLLPRYYIPLFIIIATATAIFNAFMLGLLAILFLSGQLYALLQLGVIFVIADFIAFFLMNIILDGHPWRYHIEDTYMRIFNGKKFYIFQYKSVIEIKSKEIKGFKRPYGLKIITNSMPAGKQKFYYIFPKGMVNKTFENSPFGLIWQKAEQAKQAEKAAAEQADSTAAAQHPVQPTPVYINPIVGIYEKPTEPIARPRYDIRTSDRYDSFDIKEAGMVYLNQAYYKILQVMATAVAAVFDTLAVANIIMQLEDIRVICGSVILALAVSFCAGAIINRLRTGQCWKYYVEHDRMRMHHKNDRYDFYYRNVMSVTHEEIKIKNKPYGVKCIVETASSYGVEKLLFTVVYPYRAKKKNYTSTPFYLLEKNTISYNERERNGSLS
ncbi:MAG: hypothetical protein J1E39_07215 [Eubacterium sp.]|nr:hypothetical protein [Eubacterium sp.]